MEFSGCYTALITPFTSDGAIDFDRLDANLQGQADGRVTGVVPCGTTGETPTLSEDERRSVVERVVERGHALGLQVIAGVGSNSTQKTIEAQTHARECGADAGLVVSPYYNKPGQEGLYRHFMAVAEAVDLPIMLYNVPGRSGVTITPATVARVAKHPHIQAIKEATGSLDSASEILDRCDITLLSGDDSLTLPFASVGGVGVVSVLSNLVPARVQNLCDAFNAGDWQTARELHFDLFNLARGLLSLDTNPIPIKAALKTLGSDTGVLRLPLCEPSDEVSKAVRQLLDAAGLTATA
ncbi:MAG: 4-hydroxy-tetrahydrodipicolinate synthase [Phycisphaerales bacterium]